MQILGLSFFFLAEIRINKKVKILMLYFVFSVFYTIFALYYIDKENR